jgi:hypothetical protein
MTRLVRTATAAALFSLVIANAASAGPFRLRVEDLGLGIGTVITDNGPGDLNPLIGAVTFSGAIGSNFTVNVVTGVTKPLIGGVTDFAQIDLNSVNVATTGAGTLRITLEETNFVGPTGPLEAIGTIGGTLTAPAGSTFAAQSWANGGNVVPALGPDSPVMAIGAIGGIPAGSEAVWTSMLMFGPGAFSSTSSTVFDNGASQTFSLFSQVVIVFSAPGSVSFDLNTQVVPVPEPTSLLLLGTGLAGWGMVLRRRLRSRPSRTM